MKPIRILLCVFWIIFIFSLLYLPSMMSKPKKQTLNIFTWSDIFDDETIRGFEKETGIHVRFNYFETNEEMLAKLATTKGAGHDLIVGSDYALQALIDDEVLQPIDKTQLNFIHRIHPKLSSLPQKNYAVPLNWSIYGIAYDSDTLGVIEHPSWEHIFAPEQKIGMYNDPIEATSIASFYLNSDDPCAILSLLRSQKPFVEAYADFRVGYLIATHNCSLAATTSAYTYRMTPDYPFIRFAIPEEGSFVTVESIAIPSLSENQKQAYAFLNYIYRAENIKARTSKFTTFPPTLDGLAPITPAYEKTFYEGLKQFDQFRFIGSILSEQETRDTWIQTKA